jgi:uncharacterized protein
MFKPVVLAALLAACGPNAMAQSAWRSVAVPYYTPPAYVQGLQLGWYAPRSREFASAAQGLLQTTTAYCAGGPLPAARASWRHTLLAWDALGSVAIGPLIERRSARRLDLGPVRPELMARAIDAHPASEADMERVGSPAKGFAALEALLWPKAAAPGTPACNFAVQVATDIGREADALARAFNVASPAEPEEAETVAAMSEAVNQWIGGLDNFRSQAFERPLRERESRGSARLKFTRDASGASAAERAARWQTLRALALFEGSEAPALGAGLVPLEPYLRGKGLNPLADKLVAAVRRAGRAVDAAQGGSPASAQLAARSLADLKTFVEAEVAPALDIRLGFTEADGD